MELRQLRYFVVLAEELHFTRAAARIPLAQPALSQQIAKLERELGAALFDRVPGHVALTDAGHILLAHARSTLAAADGALAVVREHGQGERGTLRLGVFANGAAELNGPILQSFARRCPNAELSLLDLAWGDQVRALTEHRVDVAILRPPYDDERIELIELAVDPQVAMVPAAHPLADADVVAPQNLLDEPFIVAHPSAPAGWRDHWLLTDLRGGLAPRLSGHAPASMTELFGAIAFGGAVTTTAASVERYLPGALVRYVPLEGAPGSPIAVARLRGRRGRLLDAFVDTALETSRALIGLLPGATLPGHRPPG